MTGIPQQTVGYEQVWFCSRCNAEVGRGAVKPSMSSCPKCSAKFGVGYIGFGGAGIGLIAGLIAFVVRKMRGE